MPDGPVLLDLQALQSPDYRGRGVARYATDFALALERRHPQVVGRFLFSPDLAPPGDVEELLATGKVAYAGSPEGRPASARLLHALSPFELGRPIASVWPGEAHELGWRFAATVYDFIPLDFPEAYLADARQRRRYRGRLEVLRAADLLLAISPSAARGAVERLGVAPSRVCLVGTGTAARFRPTTRPELALGAARAAVPGLAERFVLYPAGSDGRKNVEALIRAFAQLPAEVRDAHQLVIACELPESMAHHFGHVAGSLGIADRLVLTGYVSDETLVALYQSTALLCFPSLHEGYGLPVAEALACGAVAVVSDVEPLADLVAPDARFDPRSESSIAQAIERGLVDEPFRHRATGQARSSATTWDEVADRAAAAYEPLVAAAGRPVARRRWRARAGRKLALVSPLPPIPSGVAQYTSRLAAELARIGAAGKEPSTEIHLFADGLDRSVAAPRAPAGLGCHDVRGFDGYEAIEGGFDEVVYVLGNSEFHAGALTLLRRRPGTVLAHEVRLSGLYRFAADFDRAVPGGFEQTVRRVYGASLPVGIGSTGGLSAVEQERFGVLLAREVISLSTRFLVTSEAAARLARLEAGPALAGRVGVVPFAMEAPGGPDAPPAGHPIGLAPGARVVASFGIVDPEKRPEVLLEAFALLAPARPELVLALVGPVSGALRSSLDAAAQALGLDGRVLVTGRVAPVTYRAWLEVAEVAVQLRSSFSGEASAAVGDCLASGVPAVVSELGWFGELPDDAVRHVGRLAGAAEVAGAVADLLDDPERRGRLASAGVAYAADHSFAAAARALYDELAAARLAG